jgi:hypothetical protein
VFEEIPLYLFWVSLDETVNGLSTANFNFGSTFNFIGIVTITSRTWWDRSWTRRFRVITTASGQSQAKHEG